MPERDRRLAGFAADGEWDGCAPSAALAAALEGASGPEWRCPGASSDEMFGLLRQWQAVEAWAAAGKLGVLRALIRDDDPDLPGSPRHGDLPDEWSKSLTHEVAAALAMPVQSAEKLMGLAWDLHVELPKIGALLAAGAVTFPKARAVNEALLLLSEQDKAQAEAMIAAALPGKTYGQVERLAVQAAVTVDPDAATRRRQDAERHRSRVSMFRETTGAVGLSGRDLPTDQALAAHAKVCARANQYKESGAFGNDIRMDQYRVAAYLDILNGITADARIVSGQIVTVTRADLVPGDGSGTTASTGGAARGESDPAANRPDGSGPDDDGPCDGGAGGAAGPGDGGAPDQSDGGSPGSAAGSGGPPAPRLADLVIPLATLLGLAERPGEGHGLGPLDPDLCRALAGAAVSSPWTRLCVTVTGPGGIAIGHGCARPARKRMPHIFPPTGPPGSQVTLPSRVSLTITAQRLAELAEGVNPGVPGSPMAAPWAFTRLADPGPPGGYGTWTLTLPDGRRLTVRTEQVPTLECDHARESHAYQPNDALRHLVQVRDGDCTFPPCSRHARDSDFEHALPYDKGGRTCACNAGARSRACHQVKQSPGWSVTQPRPGWHQWRTPSGRVYTQGPKQYPA